MFNNSSNVNYDCKKPIKNLPQTKTIINYLPSNTTVNNHSTSKLSDLSKTEQLHADIAYLHSPSVLDDEFQDETLYFERTRIKHLKDERIYIQKKTFTKWCNSYINKARLEINNLFVDFGDGILFMKFLEIISGEKLGKPNRGRMRVQKIENLNKCLDFLKLKKIQLENIGAEDILDGNERLILGLIWTLILRFTIENIEIEGKESGERKHAKEALLLWCQRKTHGYQNVKIDNFTTSWRNGLAFNALIHAHRPELVNYEVLTAQDSIGNLNSAFDIAEKKLDIARLLDAEDVIVSHPDEKSIITYVSLYYHYFAKQKTELTGARRVAKVVGGLIELDDLQNEYEQLSSDLLKWIEKTIKLLTNPHFPNNLKEMQTYLLAFNEYRKCEKPPKYKEKGDLEALFFAIQTKRNAMRRKSYLPPEGLFIFDIETAWNCLDKAENDRQIALIFELQRQEKLEIKANIFYKKANVRDSWLKDIINVVKNFEFAPTIDKVEAASKMLRNISTEAGPKTDRFKMLSEMSAELQRQNFHESDFIRLREREIIERWNQFLAMLNQKEKQIAGLKELTTLVRDLNTLLSELKQAESSVQNKDIGRHMLAVSDYLQKHELIEANIKASGEWLQNMKRQALEYIKQKSEKYEILQIKLDDVETEFARLVELCSERRITLDRAKEFFQFIENIEEEMSWLVEKHDFCNSILAKRDISNVLHVMRLFKVLESEMEAHWQRSKGIISVGERLSVLPVFSFGSFKDSSKENIQNKIKELQYCWEQLRKVSAAVSKWLNEAEQVCQYFQDANDTESWIKEKIPLVRSEDFGRDLSAAESLLSRHVRLEEEIQAYRADIHRLEGMAAQLVQIQFNFTTKGFENTNNSEETQLEELIVPKVTVLYNYEGKNRTIKVVKNEVLALLDKSNSDWWRILKHDGTEGYIPANYCELVSGESVTVSQQITVSKQNSDNSVEKSETTIFERQEAISADYRKLINLAQNRHRLLTDAIKLYRFHNYCDSFETWVRETSVLFQENVSVDHIQAFRNKFKKLEHDLQAIGGAQLKRINEMADELTTEGHSQSENIRAKQRRVMRLWKDLQTLWKSKAEDLAIAEQMATFNDNCADTRTWMNEKFALLSKHADKSDLKALQALQRRYQNLERDLKPLDERMRQLQKMAAEIIKKHPEHRADVERVMAELGAMHADLLKQARLRINEAEQSQGQQMFDMTAKDLIEWLNKTRQNIMLDASSISNANEKILTGENALMIAGCTAIPAEEIVKRHMEIYDEVLAKQYEFDYVEELGNRLISKNSNLVYVAAKLSDIAKAKVELQNAWQAKDDQYKELLDLQIFCREADRIDALTKGHEVFLEINNLGDTVEGVENLLKAHSDFESKLLAQEDRAKSFCENADRLIKQGQKQADFIDKRRAEVLRHRKNVYALSENRRIRLNDALIFENLRQNVDELSCWIATKKRIATINESFEEPESTMALDRQLLKHEAFVAELNFNSAQLDTINKEGEALITDNHCEKARIKILLHNLNQNWTELADLAQQKSEKLFQLETKKQLLKIVDEVHTRLDDITKQLNVKTQGNDLRSVKELINRTNAIDQEVFLLEKKIGDLSEKAQNIVNKGHFASKEILNLVDNLVYRFNALQKPLDCRRILLEESLNCHQLAFDADVELQWIVEKCLVAESHNLSGNLTEATNMLKKHDQLDVELAAHKPKVDVILDKGQNLVKNGHTFSSLINSKCNELSDAWDNLSKAVEKRRKLLQWSLAKEQYLFDIAEVKSWIAEKHRYVLNKSEEVDEISAPNILGSIKALLNDMLLYKETLRELRGNCTELIKVDDEAFSTGRQEKVETEFTFLHDLATQKCKEMENFINLFIYNNESRDLESWINAQLQVAISEDYGHDYEHLLTLKSKFEEFKQNVKTGSERFIVCEQTANNLLTNSPPFAREILQRQDKLRTVWTLLLEYIESRDEKLKAAEQLHKFNRDVKEMEERMQEKRVTLSDDLGRDAKQVSNLILKHEVFEHELNQLHEQLQSLITEGGALQSVYPGSNAEQIGEHLANLAAKWKDLKDVTVARGNILLASYDFQKFVAQTRDFINWTVQVNQEMQSSPKIKDLQAAEWIQQEHHQLRLEIETRFVEFLEIKNYGKNLLTSNHYASVDIKEKLQAMENAYENIKHEWKLRNEWIDQIVDWHGFEREAKQNIIAIEERMRTLESVEVGGLIEEVESQKRRFETFTKALGQLEERISALSALSQQLIDKKHMESSNIEMWNNRVLSAFNKLGIQLDNFRERLDFAMVLAQFDSEVTEIGFWIDEKIKRLRFYANDSQQNLSLNDKLEHLKRYQALEIELSANLIRIQALKTQLVQLKQSRKLNNFDLADKNSTSIVVPLEIIERGEKLLKKWDDLNNTAHQLNIALKEAKDLFNFNENTDRILQWIRNKEIILKNQDMGKDYEHANSLLDKLIGKDSDQSVDSNTIQHVNTLGANLIAAGSENRLKEIQDRLQELNNAWTNFQGRMSIYHKMLQAALEVHQFNSDVDDTNARIQEKAVLLSSDDYGNNLIAVEQLLRKQDAIERDMSAIHRKLNIHDNAAKTLLAKNPPLRQTIIDSLQKLEKSWHDLAELAHTRRLNLQQSYNLQKYFDAVKKIEIWAISMRTKMSSYSQPRSVNDAQNLLKTHDERLAEIDSRNEELKSLREYGQKISSEQPEHKAEIQRAHRRLQNIEHQTRQCWEQENTTLNKTLQLQIFNSQVLQTESWLAAKEAFVNQYELGDSVDAVENFLRKHDAFTQTLFSQQDKIDQLKTSASSIFNKMEKLPEVEKIKEKYLEILQRYEQLLKNCKLKQQRLQNSRDLHDFISECGEIIMWMNAKLQLAYDDGFIDPTNLQSKLHKHLAFDDELQASSDRINLICEKGKQLASQNAFDKERIEAQLNEVVDGWNELKTKSSLKAKLLKESYKVYQMSRRLAELDKWLNQIEHALSTNDHGTDYASVKNLIKKHDQLINEIEAKRATVDETINRIQELKNLNYENVDELVLNAKNIQQRFDDLNEPCQIRKENLNDSLNFFKWASEVDEQLAWINNKVPQLESTDYGRSLHSAQSLNKKHQILEQEISTRTPIIDALINDLRISFVTKQQQDFVVNEINARTEELRAGFELLNQLSEKRALRLSESLRSQEYYAEAGEAEQWMREHLHVISNANDDALALGNSQSVADAHLRRLAALEQEIKLFSDEIKGLRRMCESMTNSGHFDSTQLTTRQAKLEEVFDNLEKEVKRRRSQLVDTSRYHSFLRQVDDLIWWLRDKKLLAEREDYGTDIEECTILIEQFEQVVRELSAAGERVALVQKLQEELLRSAHPNAGSIRAKSSDLYQLWQEVNDAANDRQQALLDGKNIHVFDQKADEMLNRLAEHEAYIVALDNEDLTVFDSATIKTFVQKHDDFLHALYVLEKQVADVCKEADSIIQQFPRTRDHLEVRRSELIEQLKDVQNDGRKFSERLVQAQNNQTYFQEYRDLMTWIRHIYTTITGEILPRDVAGCEELNVRHTEYRAEIQAREAQKCAFVECGQKMIQANNALSNEIKIKINYLEENFQQLYDVWHRRQVVYNENLDVQQWLSSAEFLEKWLVERQQLLSEDWHTVDGVESVENLIRNFDDFLATLDAQTPHFNALKRLTKIEESYNQMMQQEAAGLKKQENSAGLEQNANRRDTQQIKTLEKKKILQEKRQERERRKTQEISLMKRTSNHYNEQNDFTTLPRVNVNRSILNKNVNVQTQEDNFKQHNSNNSEITKKNSIVSDMPLIGKSTDNCSTTSSNNALQSDQTNTLHIVLRKNPSSATKTPGFTTRRAQSIKKMRQWDDLKSIDMHGYIDRKQELQGGGKKATFRSWKNYYTILCGQLLCFFKDEDSFMENMAAAPPVYILNANCSVFPDYVKRKHTFKLNSTDGAEYLFATENNLKMIEWVEKINFHARLAPSNQLTSFATTSLPSTYYVPQSTTTINMNNFDLTRSRTLDLKNQSVHSSSATSSARNSIYYFDNSLSSVPSNNINELRHFATMERQQQNKKIDNTKVEKKFDCSNSTFSQSSKSDETTKFEASGSSISKQVFNLESNNTQRIKNSCSSVEQESLSSSSPNSFTEEKSEKNYATWIEKTQKSQNLLPFNYRNSVNNKKNTCESTEDTDSIKSSNKKRGVISLFKRSSKQINKQ